MLSTDTVMWILFGIVAVIGLFVFVLVRLHMKGPN